MKLEEIFPEGVWATSTEYLIRCPLCQDHPTHNHMYINVEKGLFICHYCGEKGTLKYLLKKFAEGAELEPRSERIEKKRYEKIDFSIFPKVKKSKETSLGWMAYKYLENRGITEEEIETYDIRYATEDRYAGRVLIPVYEEEKVVCFSARACYKYIKPKYLFPHYGETILTAGEAIFGYDKMRQIKGISEACIVEGVFDAVAINRKYLMQYHGLAIMGNSITDVQIYKLLKLDKDAIFWVMLDATARHEALRVAKKLEAYGRNVKIVFLEKGDPDIATREELDLAFLNAKSYDFDLQIEEGLR